MPSNSFNFAAQVYDAVDTEQFLWMPLFSLDFGTQLPHLVPQFIGNDLGGLSTDVFSGLGKMEALLFLFSVIFAHKLSCKGYPLLRRGR